MENAAIEGRCEDSKEFFFARQLDVEFRVCLGSARRDTTPESTIIVAEVC